MNRSVMVERIGQTMEWKRELKNIVLNKYTIQGQWLCLTQWNEFKYHNSQNNKREEKEEP